MDAIGIGGITDRARDIGAVRNLPDAGGNRRASAAGRAARRDAGITRILGVAVHEVGGEPAVGKRRAIGAREDDGAGFAQIVDDGAVVLCDRTLLELQPVCGGKAGLVDIDLHGDGYAGQYAGILAAGDPGIDRGRLSQHLGRLVIDHRVDLRIDGIEPGQRGGRGLLRRNLLRFDQPGQIRGRQTPEILHYPLRFFSSCSV